MRKSLFLITVLALSFLLFSCSKDNSTSPEQTSDVKGNWEIYSSQSSGGSLVYEIDAKYSLNESNGNVSGTADITYVHRSGSFGMVTIQVADNIAGTYDGTNISVILADSFTGYTFTYEGSWVTKGEVFEGVFTATGEDTTAVYNQSRLVIGN